VDWPYYATASRITEWAYSIMSKKKILSRMFYSCDYRTRVSSNNVLIIGECLPMTFLPSNASEIFGSAQLGRPTAGIASPQQAAKLINRTPCRKTLACLRHAGKI
jgi:hypothetical protein